MLWKGNKRALMGIFLAIIMVASSGISAMAKTTYFTKNEKNVVLHFDFPQPKVDKIKILEKVYDAVYMEGLPSYGKSGEPILPAKPVNVLLPYGTKIDRIEVIASPPQYIGKGYFVEPRPEPIKIGDKPKAPSPDSSIYDSSRAFPGKLYELVTVQDFRGFQIATINLFPVQYIPKTGEIYYYKDMTLVVTTKDGQVSPLYRGLQKDSILVKKMVDNPQTVSTYHRSSNNFRQGEHYDYIIITNATLANTPGPYNFSALIQSKINKGLNARIVTTEWIYSNFDGVDAPEKIRNFIKYAYMNWGTEYVLLGGDADQPNATEHHNVVPVRYLWCSPEDADQNNSDAMPIPSDMYYACLDGNYNSDNDSRWGEPTDGPGGSDVDLIADVYVGRAPVDNATEISHFVYKTLTYEASTDPYLNNATLFGEYLGFGGPADYAGNMMELLINGSNAHGFVTTGIPNEPPLEGRYNIYTFFERDHGGQGSLTTQVVTSRINNGTNIIAHSGHGNEDFVMNISQNHYYDGLAMLHNTNKYFFAISDACDPGAFDNAGPVHGWTDDCIAEDLVTGEYGAFAVVMNARYGWGYGYTTDGPATAFQREFWNAVFGLELRNLGKALFVGKEGTLWRLHMDCTRWTMYSENLLGDPEVEIKSPEVYGNDAGVNEIEHIKDGSIIGTGDNTVWARIENYGENSANIPVNYSVYKLHKIILFQDDMESGPSKWTVVDGNGDGDTWTIVDISDPTRYSSPTHAFKCTPGATYQPNANDSLISQAIDCSGYNHVIASFYVWYYGQYDGWSGYLDYGSVYLSDDGGLTWKLVKTDLCYADYTGTLPGVVYTFPVEAYVDLTSNVKIKFVWTANNDSTTNEGMYVDDVEFYTYEVVNRVYGSDTSVALNAGEIATVNFTWNAATAGYYAINVSTRLTGDEYPHNDYKNITVYAMTGKDAAVASIITPKGLLATGTYIPEAKIANYGYADQTNVPVNCTIRDSSGGIVYTDVETISYLPAQKTMNVQFAPWTVTTEGYYTINVTTLLAGDENPDNDWLVESIHIENIDDVAVLSINAPPSGTILGGYYKVNATIYNNGTTTPAFTVNCTIRDSTNAIVYTHEISGVTVQPGKSKYIEFPAWDGTTEGDYVIHVTAKLATDEDPTNNYKEIYVTINNIDDVGAVAINSPTGIQPTGSYMINATLENFGNINKTNVLTNCSIYQVVPGSTIMTEGFEGYTPPTPPTFPPAGWTVLDEDGDGYQWEAYYTSDAHSGDYVARVHWNSAGNDDWLITKQVTVPAGGTFSFWAKSYSSYFLEDFEVRLSTTGTDPSDFTVLLDSVTDTPSTWTHYTYDLSAYAGMNVYLAVRCVSVDEYYLYVDDFVLPDGTTEGFEGTPASGWPPAGWSIEIVSGTDTDNNWTISDGTSTHPSGVTPFGNYMAQYDAYYISSGNSARLYTYALDFSTGSHHWLKFYMYHSNDGSYYDDKLVVQVSLDGTTWNDVATFMRYDASNPGWVQHMVDLSAYDGQPTVYIGFLGVSDYGYSIYIDNIEVGYGGISLVWSQEKTFDIPAYSTIYGEFGPWNAATEGNYTIHVTTLMPGDENNTNNATQTTVWIHNIYDASVEAINYPVNGATYPTGSYPINVTVANLGNVNLNNLRVNCSVYKPLSGGYILSEDFEGAFPPAGWSVAGDPLWDRNDAWSRTNYAGGNGYCADADSDRYGSGGDAYLMTPVLDLSGYSTATLQFTAAYNYLSGDYADVDISIDGGATWINLLHWAEDHSPYGPGENVTIDLTPYVGNSNVIIRWHYYAPGWDWYYEIDNVRIFASGGMQLVYGEDKYINLNGGETQYLEFGPWNANEEASYTIRVTTILPEDMDNTNNASTATVIINNIPDASAIAINSPSGLLPTGTYVVNATVANLGNVNLSNVPVKCSIYREVGGATILSEDFEGAFPPAGWSVAGDPLWDRNDAWSRTNYAGGNGYCADADSDRYGSGGDAYLMTPVLDLSGYSTATLQFTAAYNDIGGSDYADVDISIDGGTTWINLLHWDEDHSPYGPGENVTIDLTPYVGNSNVIIRWHYYAPGWDWYYEIDNVWIGQHGTPALVYEDTETIPFIGVGESKYVEFAPWDASVEGNYIINVTTILPTDENNANNATESTVVIKNLPDAGVVAINYPVSASPFDQYPPGDYTINATVKNFGNVPITFDVNCIVYGMGAITVFRDDMESGTNGWTHLATSGSDLWHLTTSRYSSTDHSWYCGNETTGQYEDNMVDFLISPALNLAGATKATLTFKHWYDIESGWDYAYVTASPDNYTFYIIGSYTGNSGGWVEESVDITPYINATTGLVNIGFIFVSDSSVHHYEGWYIDDVTVTIMGMGAVVYSSTTTVNNLMPGEETYVEFSPPFTAEEAQVYDIHVSTMLVGDIDPTNDAKDAMMYTENEPPVTNCTVFGPYHNGWYNGSATIYLRAQDPQGIAYTMYRINGGRWHIYEGPVEIFGDGIYVVEYYSADKMGAVENVKSCTFGIATSVPVTSCQLDGTLGDNGWYVSPVRVTLSANAEICGVRATYYNLDGTGWHRYMAPLTVSGDGTHTIEYYSISNAGRVESVKSTTFKIDWHAPSVEVIYPNGGESVSGIVTIRWNASDAADNALTITLLYSSDAGMTWHEIARDIDNTGSYDWDTSGLAPGSNYMVKVMAMDDAGNIGSDTSDGTFTIVRPAAPVVEIVKPRASLYIMDRSIIPLPGDMDVVIGSITIKANVKAESKIDRVEFLIDGVVKYTDTTAPYSWTWDEFAIGSHQISVVAYDVLGQTGMDRMKVLIFNL